MIQELEVKRSRFESSRVESDCLCEGNERMRLCWPKSRAEREMAVEEEN